MISKNGSEEKDNIMGMIPPPRALTKTEFIEAKGEDIALSKWFRYSHVFGVFVLLWDKLLKKEIK